MEKAQYRLRKWQKDDVKSLTKYANNWKVAQYLTDKFPHPYTAAHAMQYLTFASQQPHLFAIEINEEACGSIGLHPQDDIHRKSVELGYWLGEPYWGQGVVTAAVKEIVAYGFKNLAINRVYARPFGTNEASKRVLVKAGFKQEAKLANAIWKKDRYEDEYIYTIHNPPITQ